MDETMIKVMLSMERWGGDVPETVWAEDLGEGRAKIDNSPFYAYSVSYLDIVETEVTEDFVEAVEVRQPSGHSTLRIVVFDEDTQEAFEKAWPPLEALGCTYEGWSSIGLYSVDVPPETDLAAVRSVLDQGEAEGVWEYEEACLAHPSPGEDMPPS